MPGSPEPRDGWLREPLLHFAVLAALLFLIDYFASQAQKEQIVVSQATIDFLIQQREDLELRTLSPEERQEAIEAFIEDEILYSEAYKRGLDRSDSRMRRNMILKMRGLLAGEVPEPTEEDLREWYEVNRERFTVPPTMSLEQVFFPDPGSVPDDLLDALNAGLDPNSVGEDRLEIPRKLPELIPQRLLLLYGAESARAILAIDDEQWHGPFESQRGWHFVRITGREPARPSAYEQVRGYLEGEWRMAMSRQRIEREVEDLRDNYEIVIDTEGAE